MPRTDVIGRAFVEIGGDISPLVKDIDSAVRTMGEADAKLTSYGKRIGASFENALNPTIKLERQLAALGAQGKSAGEVVKVYGDRILQATTITQQHGQSLSPLMQNYANLASATRRAGQATEDASGQMYQMRGAAMMLEGYLGVRLPRSINTFLASNQMIGPALSAAFSATAYIAIGAAIYGIAQKVWDWAMNTKLLTEEEKKLNEELSKTYEKIRDIRRERELMGVGGSVKIGVQEQQLGVDIETARTRLRALQNTQISIQQQLVGAKGTTPWWVASMPGQPVPSTHEADEKLLLNVQNQIKRAEADLLLLEEKRLSLAKQFVETRKEESKTLDEKLRAALKKSEEDYINSHQKWIEVTTKQRDEDIAAVEAATQRLRDYFQDAAENAEKLGEKLQELKPRGWAENLPADKSGIIEELLKPTLLTEKMMGKAVANVQGNQVSTIFTDFVKGMADASIGLKGFSSVLKSTGEALMRTILESFLKPVQNWIAGTSGGGAWGGFGGIGSSFFGPWGISRSGGISAAGPAGDFGVTGMGGPSASAGSKFSLGSALTAAGLMGGMMLASDAWRRGSIGEGMLGGALAGASAGWMLGSKIGAIGGPLGMAIGAGIGALAGALVGLFGGGEKRRAEERERRANIQAGYMFSPSDTIAYSSAFGSGADIVVERDVTGRAMARKGIANPSFFNSTGPNETANSIGRAILAGGNSLGDALSAAG